MVAKEILGAVDTGNDAYKVYDFKRLLTMKHITFTINLLKSALNLIL